MSNWWQRWRGRRAALAGEATADLRETAAGWTGLPALGTADRADGSWQRQYDEALAAWRENPYAKRAIDIITDYTVGDGLTPVAGGSIGRFVDAFWSHPQNRLETRLPELMDELSRAGDLFLVLFRNAADGMSYVRAVPKNAVVTIETAENDWEREVAYVVRGGEDLTGLGQGVVSGGTVRDLSGLSGTTRYLSPDHPEAATAEAVMVHVSINRPVGALLGESELATILPWVRRYSQMLEERVRLNWAARTFLWFVQVAPGRVGEKAAQYAQPPEPGSIVIHDDGERWSMQTPSLHGLDAQHDLRALRQAIAAGSGQPPHWHGDGGNVNRAVARAMQDPAVRRLRRRQRHLQQWVIDLCHVAYSRAYELGMVAARPDRAAIRVDLPDISREDNESLALAAERLTAAFGQLLDGLPGYSPTLAGQMLPLVFKFAGERLSPALAAKILDELGQAETMR